jgi:PAS domain S-box-containing protein
MMPPRVLRLLKAEERQSELQAQLRELLGQAATLIQSDYAFIFLFDKEAGNSLLSTHRGEDPSRIDVATVRDFAWDLTRQSGLSEAVRKTIKCKDAAPGAQALWCFGAQLSSSASQPFGAIVLVSKKRRNWSRRDDDCLVFLAKSASAFLHIKASLHEIRRIEEERQKAGLKAAEIDEKFRALAANVPGAVCRFIWHPDHNGKVDFMSPGCAAILGYSLEELAGDPHLLWKAILPEDLEAFNASIQQSLNDLNVWQHRWRIKNRDGFVKWLQAYGTPSQTSNGAVAWDTLILDVTVEQEAQIALAENSRLLHEAQRMESIGRVAGGVAHDFNNLLAVIMGNAEMIDLTALPPEDAEAINEIIEASRRGATFVKQLLSFARKSDLRLSLADIHDVLSGLDKLLRRVLPANISLEISQRAGLWPVRIDPSMFESALLNVVINARDAMPQGGAITIETSNVRIDDEYLEARDEHVKPGRYVMVAVTDTGLGIEEGVLPYVFEPFFTTKGQSEGTGLELAMVQGFVKQSGGIIQAYSEPDHGTSIKMYFPAVEGDVAVGGYEKVLTLGRASKAATILLVEDQDAVRKVIFKLLVSAGYKVIEATSGDEAIEIYEQNHENIDLVLTDVVMPGKIQGPQFVRLARKINNALPVVYMSGYPHEANVHGNGIRARDISLMKPVRRADLLTALNKIR